MTSGSVVFSLSPIFGQFLIYVFNKGAVPTFLIFFYIVFTDSNFGISSKLPYILNAAGRIS